ncbi:MAG: aspartate-semialdehyde dehydrogenase [Planctomycetes bacterium]|nr:aspartate-semialdehyde dehydrogenase [Planctomycetota bacterium]
MTVRIAIAGATGAVGHELLQLLEDRAPAGTELVLLASARSAGRPVTFRGAETKVAELTDDALAGVDYAFFSCGKERSLRFARAAAERGTTVIDNSSAFRLDADVPLVVPEVNESALFGADGKAARLIANPNCSTILLTVVLAPLARAFGLERCVVSTYQAASGAGQHAMDALIADTRRRLDGATDGASESAAVFGHDLAFNLVPKIDSLLGDGQTGEEAKMLYETRKILDLQDLSLDATCVRVPVLRCHAESVTIQTKEPVDIESARTVLASAPGVRLVDGPDLFPMPSSVEGGPIVEVGRIRASRVFERGLGFFLCGDQLLKGAATNAVQIFESLRARVSQEASLP